MKIRHGFVSNSSSSSFVIKVSELSPEQQAYFLEDFAPLLVKHELVSTEEEADNYLQDWQFANFDDYYVGAAIMDNAELGTLFEDILKIPGWYSHWSYTPEIAYKRFKSGWTDKDIK